MIGQRKGSVQQTKVEKVLFLKQTALIKHWFMELGVDFGKRGVLGKMYTSVSQQLSFDNLQVYPAPAYKKSSDLMRLWAWFKYFCGAAKFALLSSSDTLLFIVAQPPYLPLLGWIKNVLFGQKYIVWIDDVMPDLFVRHKKLSENGLVVKAWQWLNRLMYSRAEYVFTLGPCMAKLVQQYVKTDQHNKVSIIPTWVDANFIKPLAKADNEFAIKHHQVNKLTILYSGNFGLSHDLGIVLDAASRLEQYTDIHFMIIGDGPQKEQLIDRWGHLINTTFLSFQPENVLPFSIATADIAIVSLDKNFEGISMPSKTYYMMSAGAAILGVSQAPSDLQYVIEQYECGINTKPGDLEGFIAAIQQLREDKILLQKYKQNARTAAENVFSREVNIDKLFDMIQPLLRKRHKSAIETDVV
ncbi:MAG: glycosyltransferase family 4 protein [Coxiellaceae bacterium]|nr:glycosyltransferase family 4 protein [Coxiellaceae bacterium]